MASAVRRVIGEEQLEEVETFYHEKRQEEHLSRAQDPFYNYRCFQNWVKCVLIKEGAKRARRATGEPGLQTLVVLDIGCGKGGDLRKFAYERVAAYVGVDVAMGQLRDAVRRKVQARLEFPTHFARANAFAPLDEFYAKLPAGLQYNLVSVQFCMHYFFSEESSIRAFLANVVHRLARGGHFVATFPDRRVIAKNLQAAYEEGRDELVHENSAFSLVMPRAEAEKGEVGARYGFFLDNGLIGTKKVDAQGTCIRYVPEFVVHMGVFERLALEAGLRLVSAENFHAFYARHIREPEYHRLFQQMRFAQTEHAHLMPAEQWETSYLYQTAIFEHIGGEKFRHDQPLQPRHHFKLVP